MLLADITIHADNTRSCKHCSTTFTASSDSAAWRKHIASKHAGRERELLALQKHLASRTSSERDDAASVISSSASSESAAAAASTVSSTSGSNDKKQRFVFDMMKPKREELLKALARAFAANSFPNQAVESLEVRQLLQMLGFPGVLPSRESIRLTISQLSDDTRRQVAERLRGAIVTVAADGWTNVKRQKITNMVPIVNGVAFYWCSIANAGENTAEWLASQMLPVIRKLIGEYGARVVGIVVDNEAVNGAAHRFLLPDLPFLLHIPCAAHTIQLIVRSCLALPYFAPLVLQFVELVRHFDAKQHRIALRRQQDSHEVKPLVVQKPCDTRWSSLLRAAERMLQLEREVKHVCLESLPSLTAEFWPKLRELVAFLKPFQIATDRIQRDSATLYTVYMEFVQLRQHAEQYEWAQGCLDDRWSRRVHVEAVTASAMLSFITPVGLDQQAAQQFILTFGTAYISHYSLLPLKTQQEISDTLTMQVADFNGREGIFHQLNERIESVKRMARAGAASADHPVQWSPRKVWLLYPGVELALVALALLSVSASEAAVERTFSAQGRVHSKARNQLSNEAVEAEMMIKFNSCALRNERPQLFGSVIDMGEDVDKSDEDAATLVPSEPEEGEIHESMQLLDDEVEEEEEEKQSVAAPSTGAERRRLKRQPSVTFSNMSDFLAWFIAQHKLSADSSVSGDVETALIAMSARLSNTPGARTLKLSLQAALAALKS